jgi:hypothetical protein
MRSIHRSRVAGLVAVALAAASGLVGLSASPAAAALCSGKGVNVVVDFNGLGGGVQKGCDPSGAGRTGDKVFPAAGFSLAYVTNSAGFVCRVKGSPSGNVCARTPPANAYWGLYWSDGKSGKWTYSSSGVGGTKVSNGGFLAFSWQNGGANDPPGAAPRNSQSAPTKAHTKSPTKTPAKGSGGGSGGGQGSGGGGGSTTKVTRAPKPAKATTAGATRAAKPAASASAKAKAKARAKANAAKASAKASSSAKPGTSPSASASAAPQASDDANPDATKMASSSFQSEDDQDGLPTWVPVAVFVVLVGASAGAVWWRRRHGRA